MYVQQKFWLLGLKFGDHHICTFAILELSWETFTFVLLRASVWAMLFCRLLCSAHSYVFLLIIYCWNLSYSICLWLINLIIVVPATLCCRTLTGICFTLQPSQLQLRTRKRQQRLYIDNFDYCYCKIKTMCNIIHNYYPIKTIHVNFSFCFKIFFCKEIHWVLMSPMASFFKVVSVSEFMTPSSFLSLTCLSAGKKQVSIDLYFNLH